MRADDPMSPEASPGQAPPRPGVRRVNNLPVYLIGAALGGFLIVMMLVAADRAGQQNRPPEPAKDKADSTSRYADQIAGTEKGGFIPAAKATTPAVPELAPPQGSAILVARPVDLDAPPTPPGKAASSADQRRQDEIARLHQAKLQQFEEAVRAKTGVQVTAPRSAGSVPGSSPRSVVLPARDDAASRIAAVRQQIEAQNPEAARAGDQTLLAQQSDAAAGMRERPASPIAPKQAPTAASEGKNVGQFAGAPYEDRWTLTAQPEAPRSPYVLRTGFVVPATLISGINAELPGQIMAQVSQDVFDTATGHWKLIPQGARLVGQYSSDVVYGQSRVLIAWQRIVFPDGKAMDIGAMPGADSAGYAGLTDQVNNHYVRLFASAFFLSGVTAGVALSQPQSTIGITTRQNASGALSEALGQQLGQVTAQLIAKNMNVAPTLEIRPGFRFNVMVTKDMTFSKPYQPFDY